MLILFVVACVLAALTLPFIWVNVDSDDWLFIRSKRRSFLFGYRDLRDYFLILSRVLHTSSFLPSNEAEITFAYRKFKNRNNFEFYLEAMFFINLIILLCVAPMAGLFTFGLSLVHNKCFIFAETTILSVWIFFSLMIFVYFYGYFYWFRRHYHFKELRLFFKYLKDGDKLLLKHLDMADRREFANLRKIIMRVSELDNLHFRVFFAQLMLHGDVLDRMRVSLRVLNDPDFEKMMADDHKLHDALAVTVRELNQVVGDIYWQLDRIIKEADTNDMATLKSHYLHEFQAIDELRGKSK